MEQWDRRPRGLAHSARPPALAGRCGGIAAAAALSLPAQLRLATLAQTARLALGLEQHEDVALAHGALHVADDRAVDLVHELNANLTKSNQQHTQHQNQPARHQRRVQVGTMRRSQGEGWQLPIEYCARPV